MSITRTAWIDDDGSGTTGTVINNAEKTLLYNQIDAALLTQTPKLISDTTTGAAGVWSVVAQGSTLVEWNGAADVTFDGIAAAATGTVLRIVNISAAAQMYFRHLVGSGSSRLLNVVTGGATPVGPGGSITYLMDPVSSLWRQIQHAQVGWIDVPYNAANFTASAGSWSVPSGSVSTYAYTIIGKTIVVAFFLSGTTVTGAPAELRIALPNGVNSGRLVISTGWGNDAVGGAMPTLQLVNGTYISVQHINQSAWAAGSTLVAGTVVASFT